MDGDPASTWVDLRTRAAYLDGHIEEAKSVPLLLRSVFSPELIDRLDGQRWLARKRLTERFSRVKAVNGAFEQRFDGRRVADHRRELLDLTPLDGHHHR